MKTIALGSDRAAKIMAVRASVARVAAIDSAWANTNVVARRVETSVPAMPLTDWQLMQGALERALAVQESLKSRRLEADIYVGLEGGFHSVSINGEWHTFLRGWAYATDGDCNPSRRVSSSMPICRLGGVSAGSTVFQS